MRVRPGGETVWTSTSDAAIYTFGYLSAAVGSKDELFVLDISDHPDPNKSVYPTLIYRYDPATGQRSKLDYKYPNYTMWRHWHGLEMMAGGKHLGLMWNWSKQPYQFDNVGVQKIDLDGKLVWQKSVYLAAEACKPSCPHGAKFPYKSKDGEALKNGFEWPIHGALAATTDGGLVVLATGQFDTSAGKIHRSVVARLNQLGTQKWAAAVGATSTCAMSNSSKTAPSLRSARRICGRTRGHGIG